jgi:hypothetical protein
MESSPSAKTSPLRFEKVALPERIAGAEDSSPQQGEGRAIVADLKPFEYEQAFLGSEDLARTHAHGKEPEIEIEVDRFDPDHRAPRCGSDVAAARPQSRRDAGSPYPAQPDPGRPKAARDRRRLSLRGGAAIGRLERVERTRDDAAG